MKKTAAFALALLTLIFSACTPSATETKTPETTAPLTATETAVETPGTSTPGDTETTSVLGEAPRDVEAGTYSLTNVSSGFTLKYGEDKKLAQSGAYDELSVDWTIIGDTYYYRFGIFSPETVVHNNDKNKVFKNFEVENALSISQLTNGSEITTKVANNLQDNNNLWRLIPNDDGSFCIAPRLSKSRRLAVQDGKAVLVEYSEGDDITPLKWKLNDISKDNSFYYEYRSTTGNILLRVSLDVFNEKNYSQKLSKETMKFVRYVPTQETLQSFANTSQTVYETYYDLTDYRPYPVIIIHAYNYQGVMAGVLGGNHNIYVNCGPDEWFWEDLEKMQYRYEVDKVQDWNFMLLHEMGHMFDWEQQWKFEGESNTNIKASYVLWVYKDRNVVAAQSGYTHETYFNGDTITKTWEADPPISLSSGKTLGEHVSRTCYIFASYCRDEIGWENVRLAYRDIHDSRVKLDSDYDRLMLYVDTIMKYAPEGSKTMQEYLGDTEWNALVEKCKARG